MNRNEQRVWKQAIALERQLMKFGYFDGLVDVRQVAINVVGQTAKIPFAAILSSRLRNKFILH